MRYLVIFCCVFLVSCGTARLVNPIKNSTVFNKGFSGIAIYDPVKEKVIYAQNEDKYFTPASNTKLFTFYVADKILDDRVNSLNYIETADSLLFWGTGNPAMLHPDFNDTTAVNFLSASNKKLYWVDYSSKISANGPGWSWNWYNYYYGPDRTTLPMYGNIIRFVKPPNTLVLDFSPKFFVNKIEEDIGLVAKDYAIRREKDSNYFKYHITSLSSEIETDKPFKTSPGLTVEMLMDTLKREVIVVDTTHVQGRLSQKLKGIETDTLMKQMLTISDNFLAEQLLVLASDQLFGEIDTEKVIDYAMENYLNDLPDKPIWVDGSGLSSYNKFTPRSIITLLAKIKEEVTDEKIFAFFPAGGKSGTIKSWYASGSDQPYIYAKTGTLNGTHCLSGYLLAKSGKILYFSFMHNNYVFGSNALKEEMQRLLYPFYLTY